MSSDDIDKLIDELCDQYEAALRSGDSPDVLAYLARTDSKHQARLLGELLDLEIELSSPERMAGKIEFYSKELPQFADVIQECFSSLSFDTLKTLDLASQQAKSPTISSSPVRRMGNYKLLKSIGEGGMGTVWRAEQERPIRRSVALKIIKSGMDSREVIARFDAERQALAMMEHPSIATILDAGTTAQGQPYFAMELVEGLPLTEYCDLHRLALDERLKLFTQVCEAVQHAHQKGVVHRDLKPSNILVTESNGQPVPKVIDFGLAKALDATQKLTDKSLFTEFGQVLGTLKYMSPEQAGLDSPDIDTRTDIYALGVILYELLTGSTPLDSDSFKGQALLKVLELVREQESPRPSSRLSTAKQDFLIALTEKRQTDPKRLINTLAGDLDWIVMKALEKDRNRRYGGAAALADDVQRYLDDDVVQARPPSFLYRVRKTARKHKASFITLASVAVLLVVGMLTTGTLWIRATSAEANERDARARVELQRDRAIDAEQIAVEARQKAESDAARTSYFLAETRWNAGRVMEAKKLLHAIPEQFRNVEWHLAARRFEGSDMTLYGAENLDLLDVRYSPDGEQVIASDYSSPVLIWEATSGEKHALKLGLGESEKIVSIRFSKDGSRAVLEVRSFQDQSMFLDEQSASKFIVWDCKTQRIIAEMANSDSSFVNCCISPDGERICAWDSAGTSTLLNASTGEQIWVMETASVVTSEADFSLDCSKLLTISTDLEHIKGTVRAWDVDSGQLIWQREELMDAAWISPQGNYIAVLGNGVVKLLDAKDGTQRWSIPATIGGSARASYDPDEKQLAISNADGKVVILDMHTGAKRRMLSAHVGNVNCVRFSPDGQSIASAGSDKSIRVWNVDTGDEMFAFYEHRYPVMHLDFSPDGSRIVTNSSAGTVRIWDATTGMPSRVLLRSKQYLGGFEPTVAVDEALLALEINGEAVLRDITTGDELMSLGENVRSVMFSKDATRVAAVFDIEPNAEVKHFGVKVWNTSTGDLLTMKLADPLEHASNGYRFIIDEHLSQIAFCHNDKIDIWNLLTDKMFSITDVAIFSAATPAFSPDGQTFAAEAIVRKSTYELAGVTVWDTATGECICTIEDSNMGQVLCIAYSDDGALLAIGYNGQRISVFESSTGRLKNKLFGQTGSIEDIDFTPDGQRIGSINSEGVVKIWDNFTGQELSSFQGIDARSPFSPYFRIGFSKDGKRLMLSNKSGSNINYVVLNGWKVAPQNTLDSQSDFITSTTFNHDGTLVATGNAAGRDRGRDGCRQPPPAQIRTRSTTSYGSCC